MSDDNLVEGPANFIVGGHSPEPSPLLLRANTRLRIKPAINPASTPVMKRRVGAIARLLRHLQVASMGWD